jgi:hypothetical protein
MMQAYYIYVAFYYGLNLPDAKKLRIEHWVLVAQAIPNTHTHKGLVEWLKW